MTDDKSLTLRAMALFEDALDLDEGERADWIAEQAGEDAALRDAALSLLRADRDASSLVKTGGAPDALPADDPEHVGAYKVLRVLGRGGMGAVYLGERTSGDFEHQAAIKVVKPGALSEALIERFQRERQILATLSHPNIAQLFDGGETEAGEPYIVMEYVDSVPLSVWVEDHAPDRAAKLALFAQICAATGFAHQSLVIHRDLTPSNILVTQSGQAKLIDFGLSRPVDEDSSTIRPGGSLTNLSLTPGFAAPERQSGAQATTLSDIYSLGKILEELVGEEHDADLDAVIAKACAEDPADRYPSADALADDLERYRAGLPVPARKGGRGYALRKFFARHRAGVLAASAGLVLLIGAFALTAFAYSRAETAREAEEARFEELRSLAHYMLFEHNDRLERIVGTVETRVELADRAQTYLSELAASSRASDALKLEAAQGFIKLARIRGVPVEPNLGQREEARENLDQAIRLLEAITDPAVDPAPDLATALALRAMIELHGDGEIEGSARTIARAVSILGNVPRDHRSTAWFISRGDVRKAQLEQAGIDGRIPDILRLANILERETANWPEPLRTSHAAALDRGYAAYYRAYSLGRRDAPTAAQIAEVVPAYREAERRFRALDRVRPNEPLTLYMLTWTNYTGVSPSNNAGDAPEALRHLDAALASVRRLLALESNDEALRNTELNIMGVQAQLLVQEGQPARGIAVQREIIARAERVVTPERPVTALNRVAYSLAILGSLGRQTGDRALACDNWRQGMQLYGEIERRGELDYNGEYLTPYLRENTRRCDSGVPVSGFAVME